MVREDNYPNVWEADVLLVHRRLDGLLYRQRPEDR